MNAMYILVPLALGLLALAIWAFLWAVKKDQFESLDSAALSIFDEEHREIDHQGTKDTKDTKDGHDHG